MAGQVEQLVRATAARLGVPEALGAAVAYNESRFNQDARGAAGEVGVMQLIPRTASGLGVDPYNMGQNIEGGMRYLREGYQATGNWYDALRYYNGGPSNVLSGAACDRDSGCVNARNYANLVSGISASQFGYDPRGSSGGLPPAPTLPPLLPGNTALPGFGPDIGIGPAPTTAGGSWLDSLFSTPNPLGSSGEPDIRMTITGVLPPDEPDQGLDPAMLALLAIGAVAVFTLAS